MARTKTVAARVTREEAAQEAEAMTGSTGRSRRIMTLVIIMVLAIGAWTIGQRVMPHAFNTAQTKIAESSVGFVGDFVAREDMPMAYDDAAFVEGEAMMAAMPMMEMDTDANEEATGVAVQERQLQKTGEVSMTVEDYAWATRRVKEIVEGYGGDIVSMHSQRSGNRNLLFGTLQIRVPVSEFDAVFEELRTQLTDNVEYYTTDTRDVTEQYVDLQARLSNKKAEEEAFGALLERSGELKDIVTVTSQIARVRGEIESIEGQLRYLASRTDYSLITLYIEEDEKIVTPDTGWRPAAVAKQSVNRLMADAQELIDNAIRFLVWFTPLFLVYVVVIVVLWHGAKKIGGAVIRRWERRQSNEQK